MVRARKRWDRRDKSPSTRINVRLPEPLRLSLEIEARSRKHSLNTEIVQRLRDSFLARDEPTTLIAKALLSGLDEAVVEKMLDLEMRDRAKEELADMEREEQLIERDIEGGRETMTKRIAGSARWCDKDD